MNLFKVFKKKKEYSILLLGNPGKTSFIYFLKLGEIVTTIPTIGFNVETFDSPNSNQISYTCWEVGGCDKIRELMKHYYENRDAFIYFLNSLDLDYSIMILDEFMFKHYLPDVPLVIFVVQRDITTKDNDESILFMINEKILSKVKDDRRILIQFGRSFGENKIVDGRNKGVLDESHYKIFQWLEEQIPTYKKRKNEKNVKYVPEKVHHVVEKQNYTQEWMKYDSSKKNSSFTLGFKDKLVFYSNDYIKMSYKDLLNEISTGNVILNHITTLRFIYETLINKIRREAIVFIMDVLLKYSELKIDKMYKYNITLIYFWIHMMYLSLIISKTELDNKNLSTDILVENFIRHVTKYKWLLNEELENNFYSKNLIQKSYESIEFLVPDIKPLPDKL